MLLTCPECGAPVIDKLDSCRECGCPIDYIKHHQTTQLECPECSNIFDESLEYCPACGCPTDYIKLHKISKTPKYSATTAPDELSAAAAHGNADAMYWLANCMYFGENGFKADPSESSKWLQKAARLGHIQAQKDYPLWFPTILDKKDTKYDLLKNILNDFDSIIIFDLETSGLDSIRNSIIELAAIKVELANNHVNISKTLNEMILLPAGEKLSPKIEELTGITNEELNLKGRSSVTVCEDFVDFVGPDKPLMISYNAQFDMSFLLAFLRKNQHEDVYDRAHTIDALTVYRDRRSYPHKLCNAIEAYNLGASVHNSHRAIDDTYSLLEVIIAMQRENSDLNRYIDLFGYLPKFGINGPSLPGIQYKAQPYNSSCKLYER